jgi:hypothetical protein
MKLGRIAIYGLAGVVMFSMSAQAFVLTAKTDAQKHRKDIGKQLAKHTFCVAKAALTCEKKGTTSDPECDLTDGSTPGGFDAKAAAKFVAAIAKCDTKFVAAKKAKTSDYQQIGCPGDCDGGTPGTQQCANLAAYEANVESGANTAGAKFQIGVLGTLISSNCQAFTGLPAGSAATIDCAKNDAGRLNKAAKGLNKCIELCENDYKDKKGNGGPDDGDQCQATGTPAAAFSACLVKKRDKQLAKILAPGNATVVASLVNSALDSAADDLFNKNDPATPDPDVNVCGTCGDNVREGTEECDGTDVGICASCDTDCTCL